MDAYILLYCHNALQIWIHNAYYRNIFATYICIYEAFVFYPRSNIKSIATKFDAIKFHRHDSHYMWTTSIIFKLIHQLRKVLCYRHLKVTNNFDAFSESFLHFASITSQNDWRWHSMCFLHLAYPVNPKIPSNC